MDTLVDTLMDTLVDTLMDTLADSDILHPPTERRQGRYKKKKVCNPVKCRLNKHSDTHRDANTLPSTPSRAILQHAVMLHPLLWMSVLA